MRAAEYQVEAERVVHTKWQQYCTSVVQQRCIRQHRIAAIMKMICRVTGYHWGGLLLSNSAQLATIVAKNKVQPAVWPQLKRDDTI